MRFIIAAPLYPPDIGGPAAYTLQLAEGLKRRGHEVALVVFTAYAAYPPLIRHFLFGYRLWRVAARADALVLFDTWSSGVPALMVARLRGIRTLLRVGGDVVWEEYVERTGHLVRFSDFYTVPRPLSVKEWLMKQGTRWAVARADRTIFNTAWQREVWLRTYPISPHNTGVIENAFAHPEEVQPPEGKVFVAAGRDRVLKNMPTLKAAFARLAHECPECVLDTRALPPAEHARRLRTAYAVVIPSVSEMSPNTASDAYRFGKPVVLTEDTGIRPQLGDAGIYVDTRSAEALYNALHSLLAPEAYAQAVARREAVHATRDWDAVVDAFTTELTTLCAS